MNYWWIKSKSFGKWLTNAEPYRVLRPSEDTEHKNLAFKRIGAFGDVSRGDSLIPGRQFQGFVTILKHREDQPEWHHLPTWPTSYSGCLSGKPWWVVWNPSLDRDGRQLKTLPPQLCPLPKATLMDNKHSYAVDAPPGIRTERRPLCAACSPENYVHQARTLSDFSGYAHRALARTIIFFFFRYFQNPLAS